MAPKPARRPSYSSCPANGLDCQRFAVEDDSVIGNRHGADIADGGAYIVRQRASVAGEIEIARRTVDRFAPEGEEHRALEDKALTIRRFSKAVEESFRPVSLQQELEVVVGLAAPLQQPCPHRCADVSEWSARHCGCASR